MKTPTRKPGRRLASAEASDLYGVRHWSGGYFKVGPNGQLRVTPHRDPAAQGVALTEIIQAVREQNHALPLILRFPQILDDRVKALNDAFTDAIRKFDYQSGYQGVFPIKVNQRRIVVETVAESGLPYQTGLEAGSKAELTLCMAQQLGRDSLLCCNGFKDDDFIRLALWAHKAGRNVVITLEKSSELARVLRLSQQLEVRPVLGVRFKLHAQGSGKWQDSGGDSAKFGLNASQLVRTVDELRELGMLDTLQMLHCHVGSQVTNIRRIKTAVREIARTYADLIRLGASIRYLNVGGGLAVDYDGSKTTFYASANYGLQEYADDVVYTTREVCEETSAPHPIIVSESGRALTAHHAMMVIPVVDVISPTRTAPRLKPQGEPHALIQEMRDILELLTVKNYGEVFHDAISHKETMHDLFDLGYLTLLERAEVESLYYRIIEKVGKLIRGLEYVPEEFEVVPKLLAHKYVCNFSLFQSLPDHWAIQALFPVAPLTRLNEQPQHQSTLVDISCDSDGKIIKFTDLRDVRTTLPLHEIKSGDDYFLGVFLTGAYQDVLANQHNLFGRVNEAHVRILGDDRFEIGGLEPGQKSSELIETMGYQTSELDRQIDLLAYMAVEEGRMPSRAADQFRQEFRHQLEGYTYLEE